MKHTILTLIALVYIGFSTLSSQGYAFTTYTDAYVKGKKEGETSKMTYVVDSDRMAMSIWMNDIRVITNIFDLEERTMTMISYAGDHKEEMKMSMGEEPEQRSEESSERPKQENGFVKTDETKNVDGFQCRRYEKDSEDAYMEIWLLEGHDDIDLIGLYTRFAKSFPAGAQAPEGQNTMVNLPFPKGFPMEIYTEPKDKKSPATLMRVDRLNTKDVDLSILDTSHISIMEMPNKN